VTAIQMYLCYFPISCCSFWINFSKVKESSSPVNLEIKVYRSIGLIQVLWKLHCFGVLLHASLLPPWHLRWAYSLPISASQVIRKHDYDHIF